MYSILKFKAAQAQFFKKFVNGLFLQCVGKSHCDVILKNATKQTLLSELFLVFKPHREVEFGILTSFNESLHNECFYVIP